METLLRYVVLRHDGIERPHFDLLLETSPGSQLQAWRLREWPIGDVQEAQRIRDHRRAFLAWEGELSGERGRVTRIDEGTCAIDDAPRRVIVSLSPSGQRLAFDLDAGSDTWHVSAAREEPPA